MKREIINHGFAVASIEQQEYLLGQEKLSAEILQPDRNWEAFLPSPECQSRNGLETMNCTNYGTLNIIETIMKRKFGIVADYSERYTGVETKTGPSGNTIQNVIETIRKDCGLIPEAYLPFDDTIDTWDKYYSPNPMLKGLEAIGQDWRINYNLGHEWIFTHGDNKDRISRLKECLQYSPIGVSVCAWIYDNNGICIKPQGEWDNHWCELFGYVDGQYWLVFDTYDNHIKKLAWDYYFSYGKRFTLDKIDVPVEKLSLVACIFKQMVEITRKLIEYKLQLNEKLKGFFEKLKGRN
jgi:hypothetical protein